MDRLRFITCNSQSTHELWGPRGSTCGSLQWWKRYEPTLSLHFFQGETKKTCLLYLAVCFHGTWNFFMELKNLVSLRLLLMPPRLVVTECEPGNATRLNRRPWGSGHSGSGGLLLRPPSCAGVRAATKGIPNNIWGKPVLKSRYSSVCGAQAESSTSFPGGMSPPRRYWETPVGPS